MAADDDGLSDPFAKVLFSTHCQVTRVGASATHTIVCFSHNISVIELWCSRLQAIV